MLELCRLRLCYDIALRFLRTGMGLLYVIVLSCLGMSLPWLKPVVVLLDMIARCLRVIVLGLRAVVVASYCLAP